MALVYFIANMIALVRIKGTRQTKTLNGGLKCEKQEKQLNFVQEWDDWVAMATLIYKA